MAPGFFVSLKNIKLGVELGLIKLFESLYLGFGKRYENELMVIFDRWSKLYIGFDVQREIQIFKGI